MGKKPMRMDSHGCTDERQYCIEKMIGLELRHEPKYGTGVFMKSPHEPIFRDESSEQMWSDINNAKTVNQLRDALYYVCCKLQELEHRLERGDYNAR